MNHRPTPTRRSARLAVLATLGLSVVLTGCASESDADDGFASSSSGGGTDSVVLAEQPWVDLQVENEIAVQVLEEIGYDASIKKNLSVENARPLSARATSTPTSATGGPRRSPPSASSSTGATSTSSRPS